MFISGDFTNMLTFWVLTWEIKHIAWKHTSSETWALKLSINLSSYNWLSNVALHRESDSWLSFLLVLSLAEHRDNSFHTDGSSGGNGFWFYHLLCDFRQMTANWESAISFPYWCVLLMFVFKCFDMSFITLIKLSFPIQSLGFLYIYL